MYAIEIVSKDGAHLGWIGKSGRRNLYPNMEAAKSAKSKLENDPRYKGLFFSIVLASLT